MSTIFTTATAMHRMKATTTNTTRSIPMTNQ